MAIAVDLIIIGIIVLSTYLGYRKGLIGVAFKIVSFLIAIVITLILFKPISNFVISNTQIDEQIEQFIIERFATTTTEEGKIEQEDTNLPEVFVNYLNSMVKDAVDNSKEMIVKSIAHGLTINIIQLVVILTIFILTRVLLFFAKAILEFISEIPIVKQCNEIGGIAYGILRGILFIYILLAMISFLVPFLSHIGIIDAIQASFLGNILYQNNLILMLLF